MYNILICDDDQDIVNALKIYLTDPNYTFYEANNGKEAFDIALKEDIHLILMDIMMPIMDGIHAMVSIREHKNVPIILLTAKSEDNDKVLGLTVGADDYITKPFNPMEVAARVKSQLRRYMHLGTGSIAPTTIELGNIMMDDKSKTVSIDDIYISLTPTEYDILKLLMTNPGCVYSPKEIYQKVWDESYLGNDNSVAVHIRHLREKIEVDPSSPLYLKVVWGKGYKMEDSHGRD